MKALIWHTRRGSINNKCKLPGCGEQVIYGTQWPDYGFDEWFLQAAIFPRAARHRVLSFVPAAAKSWILNTAPGRIRGRRSIISERTEVAAGARLTAASLRLRKTLPVKATL